MQETSFTHTAADGTPLIVRQWTPDNKASIRAVVQIVHGMAEHSARYRRLAQALTDAGYVIVAHDQRGHGETAGSLEAAGDFGVRDGWGHLLSDALEINQWIHRSWPEIPHGLLGHSMGSFVTQNYLILHGRTIDAAVISATDYSMGLLGPIARGIIKLITVFGGRRYRSWFAEQISYKAFNKPFEPARTGFEWLSRDTAEVDKYIADPFCGFRCTNQFWLDFLGGLMDIDSDSARSQIPKDLPVYLFAGDADPVAKYGKGPTQLADAYRQVGMRKVDLKLYAEGRHELFNDINRDEVTADLIEWLNNHLAVN